MTAPSTTLIDVREMTCAQALALVAKAAARVAVGQAVEVRFSTEDVRSDLIVWGLGKQFEVRDAAKDVLRLTRAAAQPMRP